MMFPRTKKNSLTKKVLSVSLIGCITVTITAAGMQPFLVYAATANTIRGLIIGASALLGTTNINPASINYLNNNSILNSSIESVYNGTVTAADIDAALSGDIGTARWTAPLSNNAQQVSLAQEYVSAAGGDPSSLQGLGQASAGQNIKAMADYYYEHGELKPAFGGQTITDQLMGATIMQSMADVAYNFDNAMWYARENGWTDEQIDAIFDSGAAFGNLQGAIDYINDLDKTITTGMDVNTNQNIVNNTSITSGGSCVLNDRGSIYTYIYANGALPIVYNVNGGSNNYRIYKCKATVNSVKFISGNYVQNFTFNMGSGKKAFYGVSFSGNLGTIGWVDLRGTPINEIENMIVSIVDGNTDYPLDKMSPDIVTKDGQAQGTWTQDANANNRNQFNLNININYDPNYNYIIPDETTINNYITNVQDDINNGEDQETIGQELLDLIQEMKQSIPQPTEAPYPTMSPSTIPVQPTEAPKPTNTPEQEQQNITGMATPELVNKFPFCIPFDIYSMMGNFVANRSAPYIKAELNLGPAGVHYIEIDMSQFDDVAALLRTLQLILFIVGLALVARRLIGAGGD